MIEDNDLDGTVYYTLGSLDYPTPRTVSLLPAHLLEVGRTRGLNLKQDIVSTLNFVNAARSKYKKMNSASIKLAGSLISPSVDELQALQYRWKEVMVMCQIQRIKRESLKYNSELQRTFQHGAVDNSNIKRKIVRPEHFERSQLHTRFTAASGKRNPQLKQPTILVNRITGVSSPWEGSQFKYEILCSLKEKLLKKMVLFAFRCYMQRYRSVRQCNVTCTRTKVKRLMQLCFSTMLFDVLSGKYIAFAAEHSAHKLLLRKCARPALCALQQHVNQCNELRALCKRATKQHRLYNRRVGYDLLRWNVQYSASMRVRTMWALRHSTEHAKLHAFTAWVAAFVKKNELRRLVLARLTHASDAGIPSRVSTGMRTPGTAGRHSRNPRRDGGAGDEDCSDGPGSPLHVLEQTPLQNLREAVSFFTQHLTGKTPIRDHRQGGGAVNTGSPSSDAEYHNHSSLGRFEVKMCSELCQGTLHKHAMTAMKAFRTRLDESVTEAAVHGALTPTLSPGLSASLYGPITPCALLSPSLRQSLFECVTAKKALPQSRFDLPSPTVVRSKNSSSGSDGSSDLSAQAHRSMHTVRTTVSDAWLHRHSRHERQDYLPTPRVAASDASDSEEGDYSKTGSDVSDDEPSSERSSSMEALLLGGSVHRLHDSTQRVGGGGGGGGGTHNHSRSRSQRGKSQSRGRLLESALSESFLLSPRIVRRPTAGLPVVAPAHHLTAAEESAPGSPYFKNISTSGAFCTEVAVDSDIEQVITERHRGAPAGVIATQRALLQRQFVEQITGAFQLIKFRWLIKHCRRFLRVLHKQATLSRTAYRCTRLTHRHQRAFYWRRWQSHLSKRATMANLCTRIHSVKLGRRILQHWNRQAIQRLVPAATRCAALYQRNTLKSHYALWRTFFAQRGFQVQKNAVLQASKKRRIFGQWRSYVGLSKQSRRIFRTMERRVLQPIWQKWRAKYRQRTLLCRVFKLHDHAWQWRQFTTPSKFQLLYTTYTAWLHYTTECRAAKRAVVMLNKARYFRGASLLATHYYQWLDYTHAARKTKREAKVRLTIVLHSCFHTWVGYVQYVQSTVRGMRERVTETAPKRRVLRAWHSVTQHQAVQRPQTHYRVSLLRRAFDHLRTTKALRLMESRVLPLCDRTRVKAGLLCWRGLIGRKSRYRRGLYLLNQAWWRLKFKLAYLTWPGRRECLLARQMHSYLAMKHKDRIALVDVQEPKQIVEVVSFVSKRRPTFVQRAVNLGILRSKAEIDGLQYYQTLCSTILQSWQRAVRTDISTRMRAFAVRAALQARLLRMCTMKWVLLTPKTSYRRVVWMTKPPRRAHDAYTHRRMLMKEYNTVRRKADRSEGERRIQVDEEGHELSLPDGTRINRHKRSVAAAVTKEDDELGEYYSDTERESTYCSAKSCGKDRVAQGSTNAET